MKPPRYLMREAVVRRLVEALPRQRFLEVGYGEGGMLATLSELGFAGDGYDHSPIARAAAGSLLQQKACSVQLLDELPGPETRYGLIVFFEVIGYWKEPLEELAMLRARLSPGGSILFSFTNRRHGGAAEARTGEMRTFDRPEVMALLRAAGLEPVRVVNYGFPLTNLLRPLLHLYHTLRPARGDVREEADASGVQLRPEVPGLVERAFLLALQPFLWLQELFARSDLGTGYVVLARRRDEG